MTASLNELRKSYEKQSDDMRLDRERILKLQNDRCKPMAQEVWYVQDKIERPGKYGYSQADLDGRLRDIFVQLNQTLQSCYNAK